MQKSFTAYFYKIKCSEENLIGQILTDLKATYAFGPEGSPELTAWVLPHALRLQRLVENDGLWHGDLKKIRMDQAGEKAHIAGAEEVIKLMDDEGMGFNSAFIYDPNTEVILFQSLQVGASESDFCNYFSSFCEEPVEIKMVPCVRDDSKERVGRAEKFTELHLQLAFGDVSPEEIANSSVVGLSKVGTSIDSDIIDVRFKVSDWRTMALDESRVFKIVDDVIGSFAHRVEVKGKIDGKTQVIDLVSDRMKVSVRISAGDDRSYPFSVRIALLAEEFNRERDYLNSRFRSMHSQS